MDDVRLAKLELSASALSIAGPGWWSSSSQHLLLISPAAPPSGFSFMPIGIERIIRLSGTYPAFKPTDFKMRRHHPSQSQTSIIGACCFPTHVLQSV